MIEHFRVLAMFAVLALGIIALPGCGGSDEPAPAPYVPGTGNQSVSLSGIGAMPQANSAFLALQVDGGTTVLNISTPVASASAVGAFVGGGTGNKAIVQLDGFDGLKVSELSAVEIDAKIIAGGLSNFYMNFLIDLDCVKDEVASSLTIGQMRDRRRIIVWQPSAGVVQPDGYTRFSATAASNEWGMVAGGGRSTYGMQPHFGSPYGPLGITGNPNACIVDAISADGGLLRDRSVAGCATAAGLAESDSGACGQAHKGALVLLGDSGNTTVKSLNIKRVKIKDREIVFR